MKKRRRDRIQLQIEKWCKQQKKDILILQFGLYCSCCPGQYLFYFFVLFDLCINDFYKVHKYVNAGSIHICFQCFIICFFDFQILHLKRNNDFEKMFRNFPILIYYWE